MSQPSRFAPHTQLDALRTLLSDYSDSDRTFQAQFHKLLQTLRHQALPELGQRLARSTTPRGLRSLILKESSAFDWPQWDMHLMHMLQPEDDLALFDEGCVALGRLCTQRALAGLQRLKEVRRDPELQEILDRELASYGSEHPFETYLAALMQGEANPELARHGARGLVTMDLEHLPELLDAFHQGDALSRHLLLHVLTFLPNPTSEDALIELFQEAKSNIREGRNLGLLLPLLKGVRKEVQQETLLTKLGERFAFRAKDLPEERLPEMQAMLEALRQAMANKTKRPTTELEQVQAVVRGPMERFIVQALGLIVEGKMMGFGALLTQTAEGMASLHEEYAATLDDIAVHMAAKIEAGSMALEKALPLLEEAFLAPMGGEGLLIAYLGLIPWDEKKQLEWVLNERDLARRKRCLEILGAREEDRLMTFFLKAMNDPIKEVVVLAIHQIGKLPSGFQAMMQLFRSGHVDQIREAIRFFSENHTAAAAKPLMGFLSTESPDELHVDAVNALGTICDPTTMNALLTQLHSGKPLALQVALVAALTHLQTPAASLGLLKKSEELIFPQVLILALQGTLSAFPGFDEPFPLEQVPALEKLVARCCDAREGAGHWMGAALATRDLYVFDEGLYERFADGFTDFLSDTRHKPSRESHDRIQEVIKKLTRHGENLARVEEREQALQALIETYNTTSGEKRLNALFKMQEVLNDPWVILGVTFSQVLVSFLQKELAREDQDVRGSTCLCEVAGLTGEKNLIGSLRDLHAHTTIQALRLAARKALLALGLTEKEIEHRSPIKSILLLEPNAFFRKRLASVLESQGRSIALSATRQEADVILAHGPVDLLITENHDATGDLGPWIEAQWEHRRYRYALLSTANHDLGALAEKPWVIGRLYKPYPIEEIMKAVES